MRLGPWIAVGVSLACAGFGAAQRGRVVGSVTWERAELALLDLAYRARGPRPAGDQVVVVEVDDATVERAPELLERRAENARLVRAIRAAGAKVIGIDLFFTDPERLLPEPLQRDLDAWAADPEPDLPARPRELLERTLEVTRGDAALEDAFQGDDVVLAMHLGERGSDGVDARVLTRGTYGQVAGGEVLPPESTRVLASLPAFNRAAARLGAISVSEDSSGAVRQVPLAVRSGPRFFAPFMLQVVAVWDGVPRGRMAYLGDEDTARIGDRAIAGDGHHVWVNWRGPDAFRRISAVDVLDPELGSSALAGRIALVGYTHLAQDRVASPFGPVPGVMLHATAVDNALAGDFLKRAPVWADATLALACGALVGLAFAVGGSNRRRVAGLIAAAGVALTVPAVAFVQADVWIGALAAWLSTGLGGVGAVGVAWLQEGAQARALRRTFAHYVSDELIAVMVADPGLVQLRGQRRELSVLFSDIRDFTSYSERIPPLELVGFLNHYLTPMTRAVLDHRGMVDKFMGDAVMAIFGAPVPDPDHAVNACRTALAMRRALDLVRPEAQRLGIDLAIGVGVNTGEVAVGNMGSEDRFEYTVLGDAVNLGSRLEGLTKTYGVFCLIGPATAAALPAEFSVRRLDLVRVKGKAEPVEIFELCGDGRVSVSSYQEMSRWEEAVAAWRAGALSRSREAFLAFLAVNPGDVATGLYLERLDALGTDAPPGWDGVFTHTRK